MKDIRNSPLHGWHLALLCLNGLGELLVLLASLIVEVLNIPADIARAYRPVFLLNTLTSGISAWAVSFGIIYVMLQYKKSASGYFKGYLLLSAGADLIQVISVILQLIHYDKLSFMEPDHGVLITKIVLHFVRFVFLTILALGRGLSKRMSWILFLLILIPDFVMNFGSLGQDLSPLSLLSNALLVVLADSGMALSIKGKYDDKAARGAV